MIPTHVLTNLNPDECVAVLSRGGQLSFRIHRVSDEPESLRAAAARDGLEVLASHLRDHAAIRELVAERERDNGGEG